MGVIVGIYGRVLNAEELQIVSNLIIALEKESIEYQFYAPFYSKIKERLNIKCGINTFNNHEEVASRLSMLISIGGDGTILSVLALVRDSGVAVAGINTGRLGFLANISKESINDVVDQIKANKLKLEPKSLIHLVSDKDLFGDVFYGLNEFAIHKNDTSSMIVIHTYIDGDYLNSYWADGLIIATPTGSTAYSLSCGGPIIYPETGCFVITPVAPHNLNLRPIVVSDSCEISFKVESRSEQFLCTLDSRSRNVSSDVSLKVKKANFKINMLRLKEDDFKNTLRNKMMWGLDKRNRG